MGKPNYVLAMIALLVAGSVAVGAQPNNDPEETKREILSQEGSEITFYGHIFGVGRTVPVPMNTQFPEGESDYSLGILGGCGVPGQENAIGHSDCRAWPSNENYWYTTAGFVQVKDWEEWGQDYTKFHNERGQSKDIYFDPSKPITGTYYMSADFHGWLVTLCEVACWNWDPGYFKDWNLEVWVWHGNLGDWASNPSAAPDVTAVAERSDNVTLIGHDKVGPFDLVSFDETIPAVGDKTVMPIEYEMEWNPEFLADDAVIPFQNDIIVEFEWYQETEGHKYITPGVNWNVNAGEDYPPHIEFPVRNPMDVEFVWPRFVHDKLVILGVINTPWGSYDINNALTSLRIEDESGQEIQIDPQYVDVDQDVSVAHDGHYDPINITWIWDYKEQGLEPGEYKAIVSATNFQGSYTAETASFFTIKKGGEGGATEAGRSGLQSFTSRDLEQFQEGAIGDLDDAVDSEDAELLEEGGGEKDTPFAPLVATIALLGVAVAVRRWRA